MKRDLAWWQARALKVEEECVRRDRLAQQWRETSLGWKLTAESALERVKQLEKNLEFAHFVNSLGKKPKRAERPRKSRREDK